MTIEKAAYRATRSEIGAPPSLVHRLTSAQVTPIVVATVLLFVIAAVAVPRSLTGPSILAMIIPASVMAVAAAGQTLVVQQKGIDLSCAGAMTLGPIVLCVVSAQYSMPIWLALVLVAVVAALGGLLNGLLVTRLHITPIIATLAFNSLLFGVVWSVARGAIPLPPAELTGFAEGSLGPVPNIVVVAAVLVVVIAFVMAKTSFGKRFVGVGANPLAAAVAGVATTRYITSSYIVSGVAASFAGVLLVGYLGSASVTLGNPYQLSVIAAVIVGGASLAGGRGSVLASAISALFLAQILQMVLTLGAPNSLQLLVQSIALAVAAGFRLIPWARLRKTSPESVSRQENRLESVT